MPAESNDKNTDYLLKEIMFWKQKYTELESKMESDRAKHKVEVEAFKKVLKAVM